MLTLRGIKGAPLTHEEMDNNFIEISNQITLNSNQTIPAKKTFMSGIVNQVTTLTDSTVVNETVANNLSSIMISSEDPMPEVSMGFDKWVTNTDDYTVVRSFATDWRLDLSQFKKYYMYGRSLIALGFDGFIYVRDYFTNDEVSIPMDAIPNIIVKHDHPLLSNIEDFYFNDDQYLFIKHSDDLLMVGSNSSGQLMVGNTSYYPIHELYNQDIANIRKLAWCNSHTFIEKANGTVWRCGNNNPGGLGTGGTSSLTSLTQLVGFDNPRKIEVGITFTYIEKSDGTVWVTGDNGYGQLGLGDTTVRTTFTQVPGILNPRKIVVGTYSRNVFIEKSDGTVWVCGSNVQGQLGLGDTVNRSTFTQVPGILNPRKIVSNGSSNGITYIEKEDGTVWSCGYNLNSNLGLGDTIDRSTFTQISDITDPDVISLLDDPVIVKNNAVYMIGINSSVFKEVLL